MGTYWKRIISEIVIVHWSLFSLHLRQIRELNRIIFSNKEKIKKGRN